MPRHSCISVTKGLEFYPFLFHMFHNNEGLRNRKTDFELLFYVLKEFGHSDSVVSSLQVSEYESDLPRPFPIVPLSCKSGYSSTGELYLTKATLSKLKQWRSMYNRAKLVGMEPSIFSFEYTAKGVHKIAGSINLSAIRVYEKIAEIIPHESRISSGTFIDYSSEEKCPSARSQSNRGGVHNG